MDSQKKFKEHFSEILDTLNKFELSLIALKHLLNSPNKKILNLNDITEKFNYIKTVTAPYINIPQIHTKYNNCITLYNSIIQTIKHTKNHTSNHQNSQSSSSKKHTEESIQDKSQHSSKTTIDESNYITLKYPNGTKITIIDLSNNSSLTSFDKEYDSILNSKKKTNLCNAYKIIREETIHNSKFISTNIVYGYIDMLKLQQIITSTHVNSDLLEYGRCVTDKLLSKSHIEESIVHHMGYVGELIPNESNSYIISNDSKPAFESRIFNAKLNKQGCTLTNKTSNGNLNVISVLPFGSIENVKNNHTNSINSYLVMSHTEKKCGQILPNSYTLKLIYGDLPINKIKEISSSMEQDEIESYLGYITYILRDSEHLDYIGNYYPDNNKNFNCITLRNFFSYLHESHSTNNYKKTTHINR